MIDGPFIQMQSGIYIDPFNLKVSDIRLEDIAYGLCNQARFSGQTKPRLYSVGDHSVRVAGLLAAQGYSSQVCLMGLLHDASEAYLHDIPRPVKVRPEMLFYRELEAACQDTIYRAFNLPSELAQVKAADNILLATERRDLMPDDGEEWAVLQGVEPMEQRIVPLSPERACDLFMVCASALLADIYKDAQPDDDEASE